MKNSSFRKIVRIWQIIILNLVWTISALNLLGGSFGRVVGWDGFGLENIPADATNVVAIARGDFNSLALKVDGTVVSWGNNFYGQLNLPENLTNVVAIAAGFGHSLALKNDGTVAAWGSGEGTNVPPGLTSVMAIAAGGGHSLAVKSNGTVVAWGENASGQTNVPLGLTNVIAVSAGSGSGAEGDSVVLRRDGTVVAWGLNDYYYQATVPEGVTNVVAIAAGDTHTVVLKQDGRLMLWGGDWRSQLSVPTNLTDVIAVDAGTWHNLVLKRDGTLGGWGSLLGWNGAAPAMYIPSGVSNAMAIAAGGFHSLAIISEGPPLLLGQPLDQTAYSGTTVNFKVGAVGKQPLAYQWRFNGSDIAGATESILSLTNVQSPVGSFSVIVSNDLGTVTSSNAALTVVSNSPPVVTVDPKSQISLIGWDMSFKVELVGSLPCSYQWQFNGVDIAGSTGASMTLTNVSQVNEGSYRVVVTNAYGSTTSRYATLKFQRVVAPGIPQQYAVPRPVVDWSMGSPVVATTPASATNIVSLVGGNNYDVALRSDGSVVAWGRNSSVESYSSGMTKFVAIAASCPYPSYGGPQWAMALKPDRTIFAWGGALNIPSGLSDVVAIAAGEFHGLAAKADGSVVAWGAVAWGDYSYGQTTIPANLTNAIAVAGGRYHSIALKGDGTVVAWGDNSQGQCNVPVGLSNVVAIAASTSYSVALKNDGTMVAWGKYRYPYLILGADFTAFVPTNISNVISFGAGTMNTIGLQADRKVTTWSFNHTLQQVPAGLTNVELVAAGYGNYLALGYLPPGIVQQPTNQTVFSGMDVMFAVPVSGVPPPTYQWQFNGNDIPGATTTQLFLTNVQSANAGSYRLVATNDYGVAVSSNAILTVNLSVPIIVSHPQNVIATLGYDVTFTVNVTGSRPFAYQWQYNGYDIPGETNSTLILHDARPAIEGNYRVLVSNDYGTTPSANATLATVPAVVIAWGDNQVGQTDVPSGLTNVVAVAGGQEHSLALKADGSVVGWGRDNRGDTDPPGEDTISIAAGGFHSLVLQRDGTVLGGGQRNDGQVDIPEQLNDKIVTAIAAGDYFSMALTDEGTVVAWGNNDSGQTNVPSSLLGRVRAIAAGSRHSLALKTNGTVVAWGDDENFGQASVPSGLANIVAIAAGENHSLALKSNGTVVGWGDNSAGQIDIPSDLWNVVAIATGKEHSLALKGDGTVVAWGDSYGHRGTSVPTGLSNVVAIAAGGYHSLAIVDPNFVPTLVTDFPLILSQPTGVTNDVGTTVTFTVGAGGLEPLSYYWRKNGNKITDGGKISGARTPTLTLTDIAKTDAGSYSIIVSNEAGTVTSVGAKLVVVTNPPAITMQPISRTIVGGNTTTFNVSATGALPMSYQWRKNDSNLVNGGKISGANSASLIVSNAVKADEGSYSVAITNLGGSTVSSTATLTILPDTIILTHPCGRTNNAGTMATFTVSASGTPPLYYRWKKNGSDLTDGGNVSGATAATLVLTGVSQNDADNYTVVVTNETGAATSLPATLTVIIPPTINVTPISRTNNAGTDATFAVNASGTSPLNYRWTKNGIDLTNGGNVSGADTATLIISSALKADEGSYSVVVSNSAGSAFSDNVSLIVIDPVIVLQPVDATNRVGSTARFTVSVNGASPLIYQWKKDGADLVNDAKISGASATSLILARVNSGDEGAYTVEATNAFGSVTSSAVTLTITPPPSPHLDVVAQWSDGSVQLLLNAASNLNYLIEASTNLYDWETVTNIIAPADEFSFPEMSATNIARRFYRVICLP